MKKSDWQYLVDTLLFISFFGISFIGILMAFFLPKGPSALESEKYFLGLHRHQWGDIHLYLSLAFVFLIIVHLFLSWAWIKGKAKALFNKGWRTLIVLTLICAFLVLILFWVFTPKNSQKYAEFGVRSGKVAESPLVLEELKDREHGAVTITGKLTLEEVAKITGVPLSNILHEMGLPPKTPQDETLGQLRKKHGFSLVEFREALTDLMNRSRQGQESPQPPSEASPQKQEVPEKKIPQSYDAPHQEEHELKVTRGRQAEDTTGILITGRMTLRELEEQTGLSGRAIADSLGLPASVSLEENLGRLRREYGFAMQEVRDIITSMLKK